MSARRLTDAYLAEVLAEHDESHECDGAGNCDDRDRIEAGFWNEVDRQIDEAKERRR